MQVQGHEIYVDAAINPAEVTRRLDAALQIAERAGALLLRHHGRITSFETKASPVDLVTIADREAEDLIRADIVERFADDVVIGEEGDGREGAIARRESVRKADFSWLIDPLDGTTNFVHAHPFFAVSIGLLVRGEPAIGVVHAPALRETFVGGAGLAPTLNGEAIAVSTVPTIEGALFATGFPYNRADALEGALTKLRRVLHRTHGVRRGGSAALDLCFVAAGRIDVFYEYGLSAWDVAAGAAIVRAAGGQVSLPDGRPFDPFDGDSLATNGLLHDAVLPLLTD